ncbi:MAG: hypothetical protein A3D16_18545 [Rhodobacterales bacterium RIFCSPHIGHO2_02_FULL_62_130]|nr:MAG: hypothetical protein A3D16_18545 [Rhodobacterales bacterium RIFCSPHIGHO2_02_FULL_62_130]OHC60308.1 MAG: hypothetical protein A3E48_18570 [Rhodobacterales bacterium RIFCSPHIGHO2_12_FULL_62_75]HCZ01548.1 hypothetical protein [Rhodobacter sp.]
MQTKAIWFLFFFVSTEAFGFRRAEWGGLGTGNMGWFGLAQLMLMGIAAIAVPRGLCYLYRNRRTAIGSTALLIGLLPVYLVFVTILRAALASDISFGEMFRNLLSAKGLIFVFLLAYLISLKNGFKTALNATSVFSLVSAISILIILLFQIETAVVTSSTSSDITRFFRALFPTGFLVAVGWMLFLSRYIVLGGSTNIVASMLCLCATIVQFHRSVLAATFFTILAFALWVIFSKRRGESPRKLLVTSLFITAGVSVGFIVSSTNSDLAGYLFESINEFMLGSGNSGHRFNIVANSWSYVVSDTFGFGLGLDWERVEEMRTYLETSFVAGPTLDSSYSNIVISSGIPGVALYLMFVVSMFRLSSIKAMRADAPLQRVFALFLRMFLIFILVVGLGTDIVLLTSASTLFTLLLVAAVSLQNHRLKKRFSK